MTKFSRPEQQTSSVKAIAEKTTEQGSERGLFYHSRLMQAFQRFATGLTTRVANPMETKYGEAYRYLIAGDAHSCRDEVDAALEKYKQALEIQADYTDAYMGIAKCLRRKGDSMGALGYFKKVLAFNAFNKEVHLQMAKCYQEAGFVEKAVRHFERAIQLDPNHVEAMFGLALVLELNNDTEKAGSLYQRIIKVDPEFLPAYNNLGSVYLRLGVFDRAEKMFRKLIAMAPDFSRGYLGLALTLDKSGQKREALPVYRQVLDMKPMTQNGDFIRNRLGALEQELLQDSRQRRHQRLEKRQAAGLMRVK